MDNPVSVAAVKNSLSVGKIVAWTIAALVIFAIADATGITGWVLYPYSSVKNKFAKKSA
jgi:hypothetical protein